MNRREFGLLLAAAAKPVPEKTVVLTFDDAVKSHRTTVGPLLKELGFRATFFVTHRWMEDTTHFLSWQDAAELHGMGFEIGNHSWTHADFSTPRAAARLAGELALVDYELGRVKVPKPVSFAWSGNGFGPESVAVLREHGIRFARRGAQPRRRRLGRCGGASPGPQRGPLNRRRRRARAAARRAVHRCGQRAVTFHRARRNGP